MPAGDNSSCASASLLTKRETETSAALERLQIWKPVSTKTPENFSSFFISEKNWAEAFDAADDVQYQFGLRVEHTRIVEINEKHWQSGLKPEREENRKVLWI